ncbi:hypothetical protein ANN_05870 [Periplaneta americana]|uniref:Uncharacterized protein n=1 Tax=Periplaneta americana TaxID=6978 RepID=A0ABQ8TDA4_PERAM|nr:hypothetical protein ANN_05870 [Periplaneta americana]
MAGLCEGGNEPPGSLKANDKKKNSTEYVFRNSSHFCHYWHYRTYRPTVTKSSRYGRQTNLLSPSGNGTLAR